LRFSGSIVTHFQKCGENVNSASYCEILLKLPDPIHRKLSGQVARGVLLHHDNARPHTVRATQERIQELQWEFLEHPPYSPDLSPSDFHLFGSLKNHLGGKRFSDDEEVETEVRKWLGRQSKDFYVAGFDALVKRWDKCINVSGGYVEK
jgi:histone-lysine N-methyltransferase SETMAR